MRIRKCRSTSALGFLLASAALSACSGSAGGTPTCRPASCEADAAGYVEVPAELLQDGRCTPQASIPCGLFTCEGGAAAGDRCAADCDADAKCIAAAHCDPPDCLADLEDGQACDEDSDCSSAHCQNGFCCAAGDCCAVAADCPTFGTYSAVCEDPATCQGSRGDVSCTASRCVVATGVPDDSACTAATVASACGPYPPVHCSGAPDQAAPACADSCSGDGDCDPGAWCNGSGACEPDLALGATCTDAGQCETGFCVDGVCCDGACQGTCTRCNLAGQVGTCFAIPAGQDPDAECGAVSCSAYYWGWGGDACYRRADVSAATAACSGAGTCRSAASECGASGQGPLAITCNATCQDPTVATCTGSTAGTCTNVNAGSVSCGSGSCAVTVAACVNGAPNACTPDWAQATTEICNSVDDDCDGAVDEGTTSSDPANCGACGHACTNAHGSVACTAGVCTPSCSTYWGDMDGNPDNGCECNGAGYEPNGLGGTSTYLGSYGDCDYSTGVWANLVPTGDDDFFYLDLIDDFFCISEAKVRLQQIPSGTDYDLEVYTWNGSAWILWRTSTNGGSVDEYVDLSGRTGRVGFRIVRYSGASCGEYYLMHCDGSC